MSTTNPAATKTISDTDRRIIAAMQAAVQFRGITLTELGRRVGIPSSTWARKYTLDPRWHHRLSAQEVEMIARALDVTVSDLYSGRPVLGNRD